MIISVGTVGLLQVKIHYNEKTKNKKFHTNKQDNSCITIILAKQRLFWLKIKNLDVKCFAP